MNKNFRHNTHNSFSSMKSSQKSIEEKLNYLKNVEKDSFVEVDLNNKSNINSQDNNFIKVPDKISIKSTNKNNDLYHQSHGSFDEMKTQVFKKIVIKNIKKTHRRIQSSVETKHLEIDYFKRKDSMGNVNQAENNELKLKSTPVIIENEKKNQIFDIENIQNSIFVKKNKLMTAIKADLISKRSALGLTMNERPEGLPPKSKEEYEEHMKLYQGILKNNQAILDQESKNITIKMLNNNMKEDKLNKESIYWNNVVENWTNKTILQKQFCKKYSQGLPTYIRGKIWKLFSRDKISIANEIFDELFNQSNPHDLVSDEIYHSIQIDVERTFPELKLFQKEHLMHNDLCKLLYCFHSYNPHLGYVIFYEFF